MTWHVRTSTLHDYEQLSSASAKWSELLFAGDDGAGFGDDDDEDGAPHSAAPTLSQEAAGVAAPTALERTGVNDGTFW